MRYSSSIHSARSTCDYVFSQLIPYIGNKRRLLGLIGMAVEASGVDPRRSTFLDCFSGSTVVSRFAKRLGFAVTANDWEPYAEALSQCFVEWNEEPVFFQSRSYQDVLAELNALEPLEGWITQHLCPSDDAAFNTARDRMFYMRKNGMKLDAVRERIALWETHGDLTAGQRAALLGPLLYQACWLSNTSGVFKAFHNGWGGRTKTALHRIQADLVLEPAIFHDNGRHHHISRLDADVLASASRNNPEFDIAYLDPPYNQHPYGSNYHVLNTLTIWDKPAFSPKITGDGDKSAIRQDWKAERKSAYNYRHSASTEYRNLLKNLNAKWLCTSYSTDGFIPLRELIEANRSNGDIQIFLQGYRRYRVSAQRFSSRPRNVEFVLLTDASRACRHSTDHYLQQIAAAEEVVTATQAETPVVARDVFSAKIFPCPTSPPSL